jgi:hypothetical protein
MSTCRAMANWLSPLPPRLSKYWIIRIPEPSAFGDTSLRTVPRDLRREFRKASRWRTRRIDPDASPSSGASRAFQAWLTCDSRAIGVGGPGGTGFGFGTGVVGGSDGGTGFGSGEGFGISGAIVPAQSKMRAPLR